MNNNNVKNKYAYFFYIDIIRSLAIILVVLLHVSAIYVSRFEFIPLNFWLIGNFFDSISRPGVPLFLLISGFLLLTSYKPAKIKYFTIRRVKKVIIPFIFWSLFYLTFRFFILDEKITKTQIIEEFLNLGTYYHLWFFYYLISLYIATPFMYQLIKNKLLISPFIFLWFIFVCVNELLRPFSAYIRIGSELFTTYIGFYITGFALGKDIIFRIKLKFKLLIFLVFILNLIIFLGTTIISSFHNHFSPYFYINFTPFVFILSVLYFIIIKKIDWEKKFFNLTFFKSLILKISALSFGIYLIHPAVMEMSSRFFFHKPITSIIIYNPLYFIPLFTLFIFIATSFIVVILKKLPVLKLIVP